MTTKEIDNATTNEFDELSWRPLINFFWDRYNKRYFDPIKCLQVHDNFDIRNNCGFLIATIDCVLIETLEQYYSGSDESEGKNHEPFLLFFQRSKAFQGIIDNKTDAGKFAGLIRSGLLHQSKTKKASIINKQDETPILDWVDSSDKNKGFKLNRDKFHKAVYIEYEVLIENLKIKENSSLRTRFKSKLKTLIE